MKCVVGCADRLYTIYENVKNKSLDIYHVAEHSMDHEERLEPSYEV